MLYNPYLAYSNHFPVYNNSDLILPDFDRFCYNSIFNYLFTFCIKCWSCFVQQKYFRITYQSSSYGNSLFLSSRYQCPLISNHTVITLTYKSTKISLIDPQSHSKFEDVCWFTSLIWYQHKTAQLNHSCWGATNIQQELKMICIDTWGKSGHKLKSVWHTLGKVVINSWIFAAFAAFSISSWLISLLISPYAMLSRIEQLKRTGSWETIPIWRRSQGTFKVLMSLPSTVLKEDLIINLKHTVLLSTELIIWGRGCIYFQLKISRNTN